MSGAVNLALQEQRLDEILETSEQQHLSVEIQIKPGVAELDFRRAGRVARFRSGCGNPFAHEA